MRILAFALALLPALILADDAWHLDSTFVLVNEQLDPVVTPNLQGMHMHKVLGGSRFGAAYNYADLSSSKCSSLPIQADKSNYWMPNLYYVQNATGTPSFTQIPAFFRWYYFLGRNTPSQPVKAFPEGLRMIAGDPDNKDVTPLAQFCCHTQPDLHNELYNDDFNFNRDCPGGMRTEVYFPACWDGINLYKDDGSHMAYPIGGAKMTGRCPLSHPVRLPSILLEATWFTQKVFPGITLSGHLAWANGDTTGRGIHADFTNGWNTSVLTEALNSPACGIGTGKAITASQCAVFQKVWDANKAAACQPERGVLREPYGNNDSMTMPALPGCNLLWGHNGAKPICTPPVPELDITAFKGTQELLVAPTPDPDVFTLPTTPGWHAVACIQPWSALQNSTRYIDNKLTPQSCQASCGKSQYNFAAVGFYGSTPTCFCGSGLNTSQAITAPGTCTSPCPGDSSATCGSYYTLQVYYTADYTTNSTSAVGPLGSASLGCYNEVADGYLSVSTFRFSSKSMSNEVCVGVCLGKGSAWAATYRGNTCYCGDQFTLGTGSYAAASSCNKPCTGNSTEMCGGSYTANILDIRTAHAVPDAQHAQGYFGCYAGNNVNLTGSTWATDSMSQSTCINACNQMGYSIAGLSQGKSCTCGNTVPYPTWLASTNCNSPCKGNASYTCGGNAATDLYNTSFASPSRADVAKVRAAGWVGCYASSGVASNQTIANSTLSACISSCQSLYVGLSNGQCMCLASAPSPASAKPAGYACTASCGGTAGCGGVGYVDAYSTSSASVTSTAIGASGIIMTSAVVAASMTSSSVLVPGSLSAPSSATRTDPTTSSSLSAASMSTSSSSALLSLSSASSPSPSSSSARPTTSSSAGSTGSSRSRTSSLSAQSSSGSKSSRKRRKAHGGAGDT